MSTDSTSDIVQGKLLGEDSDDVGAVSAIAESSAAIALSKGGARKTYDHTDPNEDGAAFAVGPAGVLVAVADGHSGKDAARIAIDTLMCGAAQGWTTAITEDFQRSWPERALDAIVAIHEAILASVVSGALDTSRTTLSIALVRPAEDCVAYATVGDSHIFRVNEVESFDIGYYPGRRNCFLGRPADTRQTLADKCLIGVEAIGSTSAIVLATDGISERGIGVDIPEAAIFECVSNARRSSLELAPLEAARSVAEAANAAHQRHRSGDNIATAVAWIGDDPSMEHG